MKAVLWTLLLLSVLLFIHATFEEIRNPKYQTPFSLDLAFIVMSFVACFGVSLL